MPRWLPGKRVVDGLDPLIAGHGRQVGVLEYTGELRVNPSQIRS
jgi:hypothetical protein